MTMTTDRDLQDAVEQRLRFTPGLVSADVGVAAHNGVVILSGTVKCFAEREAAEETVLSTAGVLDIANEIDVEIPQRADHTDEEIAENVRGTLEIHSRLPYGHIKSSVSHGVVTLHGCVHCWQDVADAEEAVGELSGVEDVVDELVVLPD